MDDRIIEECMNFTNRLREDCAPFVSELNQKLKEIYESENRGHFFSRGLDECVKMVTGFYSQYWYSLCPNEIKNQFRFHQETVIYFCAGELLFDFRESIDLKTENLQG